MGLIAALVSFLVAVSVAVSLIAYALYWYENSAAFRIEKKSLAPLLRGFFSGIASLLVVMVCYPFGWMRSVQRPKNLSPSDPVIILAHGLFHNASGWGLFKRRLQKAGFKNIFAMNYRSFFTSFDEVLGKFEQFVCSAREAVPGQPVVLIGHSLGGLVSRVYAEGATGEQIPAAVITLGSPHRGSKMVAFGPGRLALSLMYRGPLFEELERLGRDLPCPGIALYSSADALVLPAGGLKAPYGGWVHCETVPVSHVSMLFSRPVAQQVIDHLRSILCR